MILSLIGGLYFSNKYQLKLFSVMLIMYYVFLIIFGLGFSSWIYKGKLFSNTKLGYKNMTYIHALIMPIVGIIILQLAVINRAYLTMIFLELCAIALLLRYWYENTDKFLFIEKYTYKKIIICLCIMFILCFFIQYIVAGAILLICFMITSSKKKGE